MAPPHLETPRRSVLAPILRLRRQLRRVSLRVVRALRGVGPLAGERGPSSPGHAALERNAGAFGAEMSANVSPLVYES